MLLDMQTDELNELYEYVQTALGGEDVDVDIAKKELQVLARKALRDYMYEINQWWVRNNFSNIVGTTNTRDFTNKFVMDNTMIAQRISDWFASMQRIGGKIPWKKDYITLESGRQIYNMANESSVPYDSGTRRIHRVLWFAKPEIFGQPANTPFTPDLVDNSLFAFGPGGLSYGANTLGYLGNLFDVVLLAQSLEMRNKILRSEFFYNISGDILELTPMPGGQSLSFQTDSRVYYYYFDEDDFVGLPANQQFGVNELIANPTQVKIDTIPYSGLNTMAKNWVENYTLALAKYALAAKWRRIRVIMSPDSQYQIELDYQSLLDEAKTMMEDMRAKLYENYLDHIDTVKMMENKASIVTNANTINKSSPRKLFIG